MYVVICMYVISPSDYTVQTLELRLSLRVWTINPTHSATSGDCVEEGVYLAWHNGEPIEQETKAGADAAWCRRKCAANRKCAGWTLNTRNGWCALKAEGQIKRQANAGFVSGVNC